MNTNPMLIGSDPEVGFTDKNDKQIKATNIIESNVQVGVGLDGHPDLVELRTAGGNTGPIEHVMGLKILLTNLVRQIGYKSISDGKIKVIGGSMIGPDPLGGHIHFATNNVSPAKAAPILDLLLTVPTILVSNIESTKKRINEKSERNYGPYGFLSNVRGKNWGFEYRTLPSWMVSLGFAKSVLSLAYTIVYEMENNHRRVFPKFTDLGQEAINEYNKMNREYFLPLIPEIFHEIKTMEMFKTYYNEIGSLFGLINAFNCNRPVKDWIENKCMINRWGITKEWVNRKHTIDVEDKNSTTLNRLLGKFRNNTYNKSIYIYKIPVSNTKVNFKYLYLYVSPDPIFSCRSDYIRTGFMANDLDLTNKYELIIGVTESMTKDETIFTDTFLKTLECHKIKSI